MKWGLAALVIVVGMLQPIQAGVNAEFRRHADHPFQAGVVNMVIGAVALVLIVLLSGIMLPSWRSMQQAPWWSFLGGFIGMSIVVTMLIGAPRLGAALLIGCFVLGQFLSSMLVDHFGLVGYPVRPINVMRLVGILVLTAGVVILHRA